MGPEHPLPISPDFSSPEDYVSSLLEFVSSSKFFRILCGGVHVLEFFTFEPGLYTAILPEPWREFFAVHDIMDILDLLMREDLNDINQESWRDGPAPPSDLVTYIQTIRRLSLKRTFDRSHPPPLTREVALGMNIKKVHEVNHFTSYISTLAQDIASSSPENSLSHIIDLGSGQGYLPRALALPPHNHNVVGVESRENNITGSQNWDVMAKLAPKPIVMRNKKLFKEELAKAKADGTSLAKEDTRTKKGERGFFHHPGLPDLSTPADEEDVNVSCMPSSQGSVQYVSHYLLDGDLTRIIAQIISPSALSTIRHSPTPLSPPAKRALPRALPSSVRALVIALHSCGNLLHHGLRSLLLTPSVRAVAMVGCCYNLLTERLGPPTFKLHELRGRNARLEDLEKAFDPHGFPMSQRLCEYESKDGQGDKGIRLNITARMMAVQAPQNWGREDSAAFFKRHFFRALLQRVFVDLGLVNAPRAGWATAAEGQGDACDGCEDSGQGLEGTREEGEGKDEDTPSNEPVILGSLPKRAYASFLPYVRAAAAKLAKHETHPSFSVGRARKFSNALDGLSDDEVLAYEERYAAQKKDLSVVWSLMAFSAGVIEATILVDRWCWLKEQEQVEEAWVESVFGYEVSPRNMVVVGVKKREDASDR
ncbi:methyltransferase domain-containing protein 5 [Elsinoe australis]|uniref:Methyltransferase domain-containing protein 5 n=1 Tax=Elsinoe australis TaxID=40998 RepID=A0A4U7BCS1_9PEZI|nr:methyltransferase domain-containing protein 5 [Elsinoe australis]